MLDIRLAVSSPASASSSWGATRGGSCSKLADVIERLGRLSGGVTVPAPPARKPVPDWLAQRLIRTAGMMPRDVAALCLEDAVNLWGDFMSKPR